MIKKTVSLATMLLIIGLVMNLSDAHADLIDIDIENSGFEDPWQPNGDWDEVNIPGWNIYSENPGTYYTGVWNPKKYSHYPDTPNGAPEGRNVGYIDIASGAGMVGFEQTILADKLTAGETYWLLVEVGNTWWKDAWEGFPGYRIEIELEEGGTKFFDHNTLSPVEKHFLTSQVAFTAPSSGDLTIRLLNLNLGDGREVDFDYVRVSDTPIETPEPATMLLLGTGLIGLAGLGRKKFKKK